MRGIKDITVIAIFSSILFAQEQLLTFLPNVQLTVFLLVLYSKVFGFTRTSVIIIIHVLLDNLLMGSFNVMYVPFMLLGWWIIPLVTCTLLKKVDNSFILAGAGIIFALIYSWCFIIPNVLFLKVSWITYFYADILWEVILALSSFITILWLYKPCVKLLNKLKLSYIHEY